MVIEFSHEIRKNGYLSPRSRHPLVLDGSFWPTAEHYVQAQKVAYNPHYVEAVRGSLTPESTSKIAAQYRLREDWVDVRDDVMRKAVFAKFAVHSELTENLLSTGSDIILASYDDTYWGVGPDGLGENMLGRILMETRAVIALAQYWGPAVLREYACKRF